jgi:single-strand DNA-binding protein
MINLTITGNIGADATIKQLDNNTVCNFAVACKTMKGKDAVITWIDCAIWGKRGESLVNYLTKGSSVTVLGNLANAIDPTANITLTVE